MIAAKSSLLRSPSPSASYTLNKNFIFCSSLAPLLCFWLKTARAYEGHFEYYLNKFLEVNCVLFHPDTFGGQHPADSLSERVLVDVWDGCQVVYSHVASVEVVQLLEPLVNALDLLRGEPSLVDE